jgi:hypothetical protein
MARSSERVRSSVDCDITYLQGAESCRRPTVQTLAKQPDNFLSSMTVAFIMVTAMAAALAAW